MNKLISDYNNNLKFYNQLENKIDNSISGRCCHHNVNVLYMICKLYDIKTYLEIGVYNGTSMSYVVAEESEKKCYGIDLFEDIVKTVPKDKQWFYDAKQGGKSNYYSTEEVTKNVESNNVNSKLSLIKGNSHNKKTINKYYEYK